MKEMTFSQSKKTKPIQTQFQRQKNAQALIFRTFFAIFAHFLTIFLSFSHYFSNVFEYFQTFLNVFERFFLAYPTQALQINPTAPIFSPKTNIAHEKKPQKTPIFQNSGFLKSKINNHHSTIGFIYYFSCSSNNHQSPITNHQQSPGPMLPPSRQQ